MSESITALRFVLTRGIVAGELQLLHTFSSDTLSAGQVRRGVALGTAGRLNERPGGPGLKTVCKATSQQPLLVASSASDYCSYRLH